MNLQRNDTIIGKAMRSFKMFREFRNPLLTFAARAGLIEIDYCSYHTRNGFTVLGRPCGGDHRIAREVLVWETYKDILPLLPAHALRVVDVGAHIGTFQVWLQRHRAIEQAFGFEPNPDSFNLCQFNLNLAGINHQLMRQGVGATSGSAEFWVNPNAHGRNSLVKREGATEKLAVQMVSFREWLSGQLGRFDLLKMDCEGGEWGIIDGCPETLDRFPAIVAEVHADPVGHRSMKDFVAILQARGFHTVRCDPIYIGTRES
jgi:FkbM family methyltransferase